MCNIISAAVGYQGFEKRILPHIAQIYKNITSLEI